VDAARFRIVPDGIGRRHLQSLILVQLRCPLVGLDALAINFSGFLAGSQRAQFVNHTAKMRHPPEPLGQPQPMSDHDVSGGAEFEGCAVLVVRGRATPTLPAFPGFLLLRGDDLFVSRLGRFRHHEESLMPPGVPGDLGEFPEGAGLSRRHEDDQSHGRRESEDAVTPLLLRCADQAGAVDRQRVRAEGDGAHLRQTADVVSAVEPFHRLAQMVSKSM
jgi:hypothetical protein